MRISKGSKNTSQFFKRRQEKIPSSIMRQREIARTKGASKIIEEVENGEEDRVPSQKNLEELKQLIDSEEEEKIVKDSDKG